MELLYNLFAILMEPVEKRGEEGYQEALSKLPTTGLSCLNFLLRYVDKFGFKYLIPFFSVCVDHVQNLERT